MSLTKEECERALSDLEMANNYPTSKYNDSRLIDFCLDTFQQLIEEYFEITKEKECLEKALDKACDRLDFFDHLYGDDEYEDWKTKEQWKEWCFEDVD